MRIEITATWPQFAAPPDFFGCLSRLLAKIYYFLNHHCLPQVTQQAVSWLEAQTENFVGEKALETFKIQTKR